MSSPLPYKDKRGNSFGVKVAAKTFFGKDQKNLTIDEAAILIGLLKAPTDNGPTRYIREEGKQAIKHRKEMVELLLKEGYIDIWTIFYNEHNKKFLKTLINRKLKKFTSFFKKIALKLSKRLELCLLLDQKQVYFFKIGQD